MSFLDLILLIPIGLTAVRGFAKGFILELFSFIALVVAIIGCMKVAQLVTEWLQPVMEGSSYIPFVAFLIAFIGIYILVYMAGRLLEGAVSFTGLGMINKLAGAAFAILKVCFMISLFLWLSDRVNLFGPETREKSFMYAMLDGFAENVIASLSFLLPFAKTMLAEIETFFEEL